MLRKIIYSIINVISVLIIAAAIVILCMVVLTEPGKPPEILGTTVLRVTTGSMEPTYPVDTLIVVKKTDPDQIQEGDVISFYSSDPALDGAINTHRVVSVQKDADQWIYTTRGDANNTVDSYKVKSTELIGKVIWHSISLGKLSRLTANPLVFIPLILLPLAVILISNLVHTISLAGRIAKEEEERAVKEAVRNIREKQQEEKNRKEAHPDEKLQDGEQQGEMRQSEKQ